MSPARLRTQPDATLPVAWLDGEIDLANAASLGADLAALVPNTALGLVIDLSGVTYLDSSGISVLFGLARQLSNRAQVLRLVVPEQANIARTLTLAGIHSVATVSPVLERDLRRTRDRSPETG